MCTPVCNYKNIAWNANIIIANTRLPCQPSGSFQIISQSGQSPWSQIHREISLNIYSTDIWCTSSSIRVPFLFYLFIYFIIIIIIIIYYTGIASTPLEQTATKAHAVVNDNQLNSSVFSSFLNIVNDKDGSFRTIIIIRC